MEALEPTREGRVFLNAVANVAVILVGAFCVFSILFNVDGSRAGGTTALGVAELLLILVAYVAVALRATSPGWWIIVAAMALLFGFSIFGPHNASPAVANSGPIPGALLVFVPLLILWWGTRPKRRGTA